MPITDPFTVVVRLSEGESLGATMSKLRAWLDCEKIHAVEFKIEVDARGYTFRIGFPTIEAADRFRSQFGSKDDSERAA